MDFLITFLISFSIGVHEICLEEELAQDLITQDILEVYQKVFLKQVISRDFKIWFKRNSILISRVFFQALELILLPEVIVAIHVPMRK